MATIYDPILMRPIKRPQAGVVVDENGDTVVDENGDTLVGGYI